MIKVDYNTDTKLYSIIEIEPGDMAAIAAACGAFAHELTKVTKALLSIKDGHIKTSVE